MGGYEEREIEREVGRRRLKLREVKKKKKSQGIDETLGAERGKTVRNKGTSGRTY